MLKKMAICLAGASLVLTPTVGHAEPTLDETTVPVQLLSITDLHGYIGDYTTTVPGAHQGEPRQNVGGGPYLATHLKQLAEGKDNSILFSAGDDFTGWPSYTGYFWNEPTIEFLNYIGLEFSTIGNHELDRNLPYLEHMLEGTCEGRPDDDLCFTDSQGRTFHGADYDYYSANVIDTGTGEPVVEPYHVRTVDDGEGGTMKVGFVHATVEDAVSGGMSYQTQGVRIDPMAASVNRYADELDRQGVKAIVAVVHDGFSQQDGPPQNAGYNDCVGPFGPVFEANKQISPKVDIIVTGHWHALVNCSLLDPSGQPRPVVEAANHGRLISEINLELDPAGEVVRDRTVSTSHANTQDVVPDAGAEKIRDYWVSKAAERGATQVGSVTADITRAQDDTGESAMNNLVADALWFGGRQDVDADLAVVLPGVTRRDFLYAPSSAGGDGPGTLLFGEVLVGAVIDSGQGQGIVAGDLTGGQLEQMLEAQWSVQASGEETFTPIGVSDNVTYRFDDTRPVGDRVMPGWIKINGKGLAVGQTYRIASPSGAFAVAPESRFGILAGATDQERSLFNASDALWHYAESESPLAPPATDRVNRH